ncbi:MAG: RelA/SpoT domain-containing protein [Alphaproteobacteria bacterium]|nr:RelA/SpoT domain-containing protein [Alphaproteobacteria bacterium]
MNLDEYEREGRAKYAAFADTVSSILAAAVGAEGGYRLQQIKTRAKHPSSLRQKLRNRNIEASSTIECDIKDLAGCRAIFYTNTDVARMISSGIIHQNFEVDEVKIHHPSRTAEEAAQLYISNHYIVKLKPERLALAEYAQFSGMRCEIQIQTILNHAWAEMAHDTIYKAPQLDRFGSAAFAGIEKRMQKIARKYLLPAGYEFQSVAIDFQRLLDGKALFDRDALEEIVGAEGNNVRAELLEKFSEVVLPNYDNIQAEYTEIVRKLIAAAENARTKQPVTIQTPYGQIPPKTYADITEAIAEILTQYRYFDISVTFEALCILYGLSNNEEERKPLIKLAETLGKHNINAWRQAGPIVQMMLTDRIEVLPAEERVNLLPLLITVLNEVLGTEVSGTSNSSSAITIHRGSVIFSEALQDMRSKAIGLLKTLFHGSDSEENRATVLRTLHAVDHLPNGTEYSNELTQLVLENTKSVVEFLSEISPALSLELKRTSEVWINQCFWRFADLPGPMQNDSGIASSATNLIETIQTLRDTLNSDHDFITYKTLVGFDSVFPPAWDNHEFEYTEQHAYRNNLIDELVAEVSEAKAGDWFEKLGRYALTKSDDLATFQYFGSFIDKLAATKPSIALSYIERLDENLTRFLPGILSGIMSSGARPQAIEKICLWLEAGSHVHLIAWYLRFADPFDETLLIEVLNSAITHSDKNAVYNVLIAAADQFGKHPGTLIETAFLPALRYLHAEDDFTWIKARLFSWLDKPILRALSEAQAIEVLDALVPYQRLEHNAEYVAGTIAKKWPRAVVDFIGKRLEFSRSPGNRLAYSPIPYSVHQLRDPFAAIPGILLESARTWYSSDPQSFPYQCGRLFASVFPDLSHGLDGLLEAMLSGGNAQDIPFLLAILQAFDGRPCIYPHIRRIVAILEAQSPLLGNVKSALDQTGMVTGEFGSSDLHTQRQELVREWLADGNDNVRQFAENYIRRLDLMISAETRSAEERIAQRRLEYGEELDIEDEPSGGEI